MMTQLIPMLKITYLKKIFRTNLVLLGLQCSRRSICQIRIQKNQKNFR